MRPVVVVSTLVLAACASRASTTHTETTAAVLGAEACTLWGDDGEVAGRRIEEETFSVCMPEAWTRAGARRWESRGFIRWEPRERAPLTSQQRRRSRLPALDQMSTPERQLLRIGEREASLYRRQVNGKYLTRLSFQQERLTFEGEAMSLAESTLQLAVYRSVRFTISTP